MYIELYWPGMTLSDPSMYIELYWPGMTLSDPSMYIELYWPGMTPSDPSMYIELYWPGMTPSEPSMSHDDLMESCQRTDIERVLLCLSCEHAQNRDRLRLKINGTWVGLPGKWS